MSYTIDTMVTPGAGWVLVDDPADCKVTVQAHTVHPWFVALHADAAYTANSEGLEMDGTSFEFEVGNDGIGVYVNIPDDFGTDPVRVTSLGIDRE